MKIMGRKIKKKDVPRYVGMSAALLVALMFTIAVSTTAYGIYEAKKEISNCDKEITQKESELEQLKQKKAYYESDEYLEEVVRSSGYVNDDETVFVITD